jgi:hypothetical protein
MSAMISCVCDIMCHCHGPWSWAPWASHEALQIPARLIDFKAHDASLTHDIADWPCLVVMAHLCSLLSELRSCPVVIMIFYNGNKKKYLKASCAFLHGLTLQYYDDMHRAQANLNGTLRQFSETPWCISFRVSNCMDPSGDLLTSDLPTSETSDLLTQF